jgi:putative NADPH-quinone reductase
VTGRRRALVVHAHPRDDSFSRALFDLTCESLSSRYDVVALDLYGLDFDPVMSEDEWHAYPGPEPILDPEVVRHADLIRTADLVAFVYPTWWFGPPAVVVGWLQRVLVPGVGFVFGDDGRVRPALVGLRTIVGVSTYGSGRLEIGFLGDGGRRMLLRALRLNVPHRVRTKWFGLYGIDASDRARREAFLERVAAGIGRL